MSVQSIAKQAGAYVSKNSPALLTGLGLFGFGASIVFAVEATPKAQAIIEDLNNDYDDVPKIEYVKKVAPVYIPTILMVGVSTAAIISAYKINAKRLGVLAGLYSVSEAALKEYQAKVIEQIGEKKAEKVREAVVQDHLDRNPASQSQVIVTGKGDSLCYDAWSGRYFQSDYEKVRAAVNSFNRDIISDIWAPLNDFYYYLGLPQVTGGAELGFDVDHMIDVKFSSHVTDDGRTALVLDFGRPRPRF